MSGVLLDGKTGRPLGDERDPLREALLTELAKRDMGEVEEMLRLGREFPELQGARQYFEELVLDPPSADLTAVTATVETSLWSVPLFSATSPMDARAGKVWILRASGVITTTATPGNVTITPRWGTSTGGLALGASPAKALTASITAGIWQLEAWLWCRQIGTAASTSTLHLSGMYMMGDMQAMFGGTTVTTADTTTAQGLFIGHTFSAASQSITPKAVGLSTLN